MNFFAFGQALADGRAQRMQIDEQRDVNRFNIKVDEQNAATKGQQTSAAEEAQRRQARQALGAERAGIAESGVGFGGSSLDVMRRSTKNAELDAMNIRYAGDLERAGILNKVEMGKYQDKVLEKAGMLAMRMRWGNALSGLFGGASGSMGGATNQMGQSGQMGQQQGAYGSFYGQSPTSNGGNVWNGYSAYAGKPGGG